MRKVLKGVLKWLLRILLGLIGLLVIAVIVFALFKGKIKDKALSIANEKQPGIVMLDDIRLRPLIHFPDVSLQLIELSYQQGMDSLGQQDTIPVMSMDDIYVSLDIVQLIKGKYKVSKVRFGDGQVNYIVGEDSISNIEKALGIRFGASKEEKEPKEDSTALSLAMDDLEISNLSLNYVDLPGGKNVSVRIKQLKSAFNYLPELITAELNMGIDVDRAEIGDIILDKPRSIVFSSALNYDLIEEIVSLNHGILDLQEAKIMLSGNISMKEGNDMDLNFSAKNEGIELLNFLLRGVLDMDAIEQIGSGEIHLGGDVKGSFGEGLPLINVDFNAKNLGFKVNAIGQSITDINFAGSASNGKVADFSEAVLQMDHLHASFPQGGIDMSLQFANLVTPSVDLNIEASADLALVNEILDSDALQNMKGKLTINGNIQGTIDKLNDVFLDESSKLTVQFQKVSLSLPDNELRQLDGELYIDEASVGFREMDINFDGNSVGLDAEMQDVLPYFLGFKRDPHIRIALEAKELYLDKILSDTSLTNIISGPITDLGLGIVIDVPYEQFDKAIKENAIPELNVHLEDMHMQIPGYTYLSDVNFDIQMEEKDLSLRDFEGKVGRSSFNLDVHVKNYNAYLEKDSLSPLAVEFKLTSRLLDLSELLTFNDSFHIVPADFKSEEIRNFIFEAKLETKVGELLKDNGLPDFYFKSKNLHWDLKHYPLSFKGFEIEIRHANNFIVVDTLGGRIGDSNFKISASVVNLLDSTKAMSGNLKIRSDLLDLNKLMDYKLLAKNETLEAELIEGDSVLLEEDSAAIEYKEPINLDIPRFQFTMDIKELRYDENNLYDIQGKIRSTMERLVYLDKFQVKSETGGSILVNGQLNLNDPNAFYLSSTFDIDTLNVSDLKVDFAMGDTVYTLDETFTGILDARGMAELVFTPHMSMDLSRSTASFILSLKNGSVMNFTPLQAAAKFTGSANLNNVQFGEIRNRFTLVDETIYVPLMSINSTLGQLGVEGEQGLDGHYMYLVRIPPGLVSGTAKNVLSGQKESDGDDKIAKTKSGTYMVLTVSDKGVRPGDRRDKFDEEE